MGFKELKILLKSGTQPYKGSTKFGHSLSKHAARHPNHWGKLTGALKTWHQQALKQVKEIVRAPGAFQPVTDPTTGRRWLEKRLPDGRGIRLQRDYTFKGLID